MVAEITLAAAVCLLLVPPGRNARFWAWFLSVLGLSAVAYWVSSQPVSPLKLSAFVGLSAVASVLVSMVLHERRGWSLKAALPSILIVFISLLIIKLSTPSGSAEGWHEWLMATFGLKEADAIEAVHWIRKVIHFCAYGSCGLVAWHWFRTRGLAGPLLVGLAITWAAGHACFDELRQSQYSVRQGRFQDVCLDLAGAGCFLWLNQRRKRNAV